MHVCYGELLVCLVKVNRHLSASYRVPSDKNMRATEFLKLIERLQIKDISSCRVMSNSFIGFYCSLRENTQTLQYGSKARPAIILSLEKNTFSAHFNNNNVIILVTVIVIWHIHTVSSLVSPDYHPSSKSLFMPSFPNSWIDLAIQIFISMAASKRNALFWLAVPDGAISSRQQRSLLQGEKKKPHNQIVNWSVS